MMMVRLADYSLQKKLMACLALVSAVLVCLSAIILLKADQDRKEAMRLTKVKQCADHLFLVMKDISFERGRAFVVLSSGKLAGESDREFILERRALSEGNFGKGADLLEEIDPVFARELKEEHDALQLLRTKVDSRLFEAAVMGDKGFEQIWFNQTTQINRHIIQVIAAMWNQQSVEGVSTRYFQYQLDAMEFRLAAGESAATLIAAMSKPQAWTVEEYRKYTDSLARTDYIWAKLVAELEDLKDEPINQATARIKEAYYGNYRKKLEGYERLGFTSESFPAQVDILKKEAIPALDGVYDLIATIDGKNAHAIEEIKATSKFLYGMALVQFLAGVVLVAFVFSYFRRALFDPLGRIILALERLNLGTSVDTLELGDGRSDEIGKLADGVRRLQISIGEERRLKSEVEYLATIDTLTGCLNKGAFYKKTEAVLIESAKRNNVMALVMMDLDDMKEVNDTYGHLAGDALLQHVVRIIRENVRPDDILSRFGGDEFVLCMAVKSAGQERAIVDRIHEALRTTPFCLEDKCMAMPVKACFGVSTCDFTSRACEMTDLMTRADKALYRAKEAGGNRVEYDSDFESQSDK